MLRKSNEFKPPVVGVGHDNDVGSSVDPADAVLGDADVLALVVHLCFLLVSKSNWLSSSVQLITIFVPRLGNPRYATCILRC